MLILKKIFRRGGPENTTSSESQPSEVRMESDQPQIVRHFYGGIVLARPDLMPEEPAAHYRTHDKHVEMLFAEPIDGNLKLSFLAYRQGDSFHYLSDLINGREEYVEYDIQLSTGDPAQAVRWEMQYYFEKNFRRLAVLQESMLRLGNILNYPYK